MNRELAKIMASADESYLNFQPDLGYETQLNAEGAMGYCAAPQSVAKPYIFTITNTAGTLANAILFGSNIYLGSANYGSDAGITITPANGVTYYQMLQNIKEHPVEFLSCRISCSVSTQLDQSMTAYYTDVNGRGYYDPIPLSSFRNSFQQATDLVDFEYALKADGNSYIKLPIVGTSAGTTTVVLTLYPNKMFDGGASFVNASTTKVYDTPVLSGTVSISKQVAAASKTWPTVVLPTGKG